MSPYTHSSAISLGISCLLLLFATPCNADAHDDSPFNLHGTPEDIQAHLLGPQLPVMILPPGGHTLDDEFFRPSHKLDFFSSVVYKGSRQLQKVTLKHDDHPYVHLDPIEAVLTRPVECRPDAKAGHNTNLTLDFTTVEFFERAQRHWNPSPESPIHFVVEGPHCFQAGGDRSVYRSTAIEFDLHVQRVVIEAEPLHSHVAADTHWASDFSIQSYELPDGHVIVPRASAGELHKRNFPDLKAGWGHQFEDEKWGPRHEFFPKAKEAFNKYLRVPTVNVTCIECHTRGKIRFEFLLDFNLRPWKHRDPACDKAAKPSRRSSKPSQRSLNSKRSPKASEFLQKHEGIQSTVVASIEAQRIARHREAHTRLRKRDEPLPHPFQWLSCPESDPSYPVCHDKQIDQKRPADCWKSENVFLSPTHATTEAGKCLLHTLGGHLDCWNRFENDLSQFDGLSDYVVAFIRAHVNNLEIQIIVEEDLDLRFQLEFLTTLDVGAWFDLDVFPHDIANPLHQLSRFGSSPAALPFIEASAGWFFRPGGAPVPTRQDLWSQRFNGEEAPKDPITKDPIYKKHLAYNQEGRDKVEKYNEWKNLSPDAKKGPDMLKEATSPLHGLGLIVFDVVPLTISSLLDVHVSINMTSPGLNVKMTKGRVVLRPLDEDPNKRYQNDIFVDLDYLKAALEIGEDYSVTFRVSAGPRVKFHLFPVAETGVLATINDNVGKGGLGLSEPLSFGAHFQPVRLDLILAGVLANDKDCVAQSGGGNFTNGGLKLEAIFRTGLDAYAASFSQRIDTGFLHVMQTTDIASEAANGLWWSKRLAYLCHEWSSGNGSPAYEFNHIIAKILSTLQEPVEEAFTKLGRFLSASSEMDPNDARFRTWNANNSTLKDSLEYFSWHKNVVGSDLELPDLCQPEGICDPFSEFYIPAGVTDTIRESLNDWYHAVGGIGNITDPHVNATVNATTGLELWKQALEYNSSTVVIHPSTSSTRPATFYYDSSIPAEFQWISGQKIAPPTTLYNDSSVPVEFQWIPSQTIPPVSATTTATATATATPPVNILLLPDSDLPTEWRWDGDDSESKTMPSSSSSSTISSSLSSTSNSTSSHQQQDRKDIDDNNSSTSQSSSSATTDTTMTTRTASPSSLRHMKRRLAAVAVSTGTVRRFKEQAG